MIAKFVKTILFIFIFILLTAPFVHAVVLESGIPGQTGAGPGDLVPKSIAQYINYLYLFVLGVVGIAVFASLVFWGVVWISSGIADRRGEALGKIKDAFTGLAIALGAYIILNTINPDLLKLEDLNLSPLTTTTNTTKGGYFWFNASSTCSDIVGATNTDRGDCRNVQCNSGACMQNNTLRCCYLLPYKYDTPQKKTISATQACEGDPSVGVGTGYIKWTSVVTDDMFNPCNDENVGVDPKYSTSTPTDRIMTCYEMGFGGPNDVNNKPVACYYKRQ